MLLSSLQLLIAYERLRSRISSMLTSGLPHCFIVLGKQYLLSSYFTSISKKAIRALPRFRELPDPMLQAQPCPC